MSNGEFVSFRAGEARLRPDTLEENGIDTFTGTALVRVVAMYGQREDGLRIGAFRTVVDGAEDPQFVTAASNEPVESRDIESNNERLLGAIEAGVESGSPHTILVKTEPGDIPAVLLPLEANLADLASRIDAISA